MLSLLARIGIVLSVRFLGCLVVETIGIEDIGFQSWVAVDRLWARQQIGKGSVALHETCRLRGPVDVLPAWSVILFCM
jgi:hypothetical protein